MTPKEKAKELVDKFKELYDYGSLSKECALIAVDELIELSHSSILISTIKYWKEVKQEIEKL